MTQVVEPPVSGTGTEAVPSQPPTSWRSPIDAGVGCLLGLGWCVTYGLAVALEPAPRDPAMVHAWYVTVINLALLTGLGVMVVGLVARRRFGLYGSVLAAGAFLAAVIACPLTGHHAFGVWWIGQLALAFAIAGGTALALHRTRAG